MKSSILLASFLIAAILVWGISGTFARTGEDTGAAQAVKTGENTPSEYPVVLDNHTLFSIKEVTGFSARTRAQQSSERLKEIAANRGIPVESVTIHDYTSPMTLINAGNKMLLAILDEDARKEGRDRQELAGERAQTMRKAIEDYRRRYGIRGAVIGGSFVLGATMFLVFILIILNRVYHVLEQKVDSWAESKKIAVSIQKFELVRAERIKMAILVLVKVLRFVVYFILVYSYVHSSLGFLPWTRGFADQLLNYIIGPLKMAGGAIGREIPGLVVIVIIILVTRYALKIIRLFFSQVGSNTIQVKGFYPDWADPTYKICRLFIVAFAGVMAYPYIPGSGSLAFKGITVFLGALISIGSSSAVANIIAGYTLIYRRVFKVGDRVKVADFVGDVVEIRLQVVHLRTIKNEEIVVPSSMVVSNPVINYSYLAGERGLILHTTVTIGYDAPWRQVEALLLLAAKKTAGLRQKPAPFILQTSLDDFYVSYELNVYTERPDTMAETYAELHRNIQDTFNEYDVQIMSPSYRGDPEQPKVVPRDRWYTAPARRPEDTGGGAPE